MHPYRYAAFGLGIHSVLPLPELVAEPDIEADILIEWGRIQADHRSNAEQMESSFEIMNDRAYLFWDLVGSFEVQEGKRIIVDPRPGVKEQILRLPLLGAVIATLLHQRGILVLHGSAVGVDGQAVAFLGNKGMGKSTLAAALYTQNHKLLADDLTAVQDGGSRPSTVLSAFPQLKLWPEAAAHALGDDAEALPRLHPDMEKRARRIEKGFLQESTPLKFIYILESGPILKTQLLDPHMAVIELIRNSFIARFGSQFLQHGGGLHLRQCVHLAKNVPVYRLIYPHALSFLPSIVELLTAHIAGKPHDALI